jgi:hypothetical protein
VIGNGPAVTARADQQLNRDTVFAYKGEDGFWGAVPALIILDNPDAEIGFARSKVVSESVVLKVRSSEVPTAAKGDTVTIGAAGFLVTDAPRFDADDVYRLVWVAQAKRL